MSSSKKEVLMKINSLTKAYGDNLILDRVSFDIYDGEIFGLIGLSGTGKTTLLSTLCGFLRPNYGEIQYLSSEYKQKNGEYLSIYLDNEHLKSIIGFSSQKPSFYEDMTVFENLKYFGVLNDISGKYLYQKIVDLLQLLKLEKASKTLGKDLSEGMKKRLDFACSLIHDPKILILDEPTSNLDFKLRDELYKYIKKINRLGITIIFVSHYFEEIESLATRVGLLYKKKIHIIHNRMEAKNKFLEFLEENGQNGINS